MPLNADGSATCDGCNRELHVDHVTLVTTKHVRRFCAVECINAGHKRQLDEIVANLRASEMTLIDDRDLADRECRRLRRLLVVAKRDIAGDTA